MEKVLIIVGPTGVGKTSLSISMAQTFHGEIISGDSMQVYKNMDIGTAKIKKEEMMDVPHFLVDCFSFIDDYNVMIFQEIARKHVKEIHDKGCVPIICGGTGLYIKSAIYDYRFLEQKKDEEFMSFLNERSNDELWGMLKVVDPKVCESIHQNNRQRIVRALYMAHTGEKKSDIIESQEHTMIYDAYIIGLTMDRERLYERINQRVDQMIKEGLLEEIKSLVSSHENVWDLQSFQGIGYKEWKEYFEGSASIEESVEKIKKNSRNFAKRQYTWFRNQMQVHWYDIETSGYPECVVTDVKEWLDN
ncbi:tRNA (adenosine(37)-N6)-dimethylallyltransferase MiaA [Amedibacillus sp. YH-ame10]